jgi:5'-methylthioadenosine phosphorylase
MTKIALILGYCPSVLPKFEVEKKIEHNTPYGKPSSDILFCRMKGSEIFIIQRYGVGNELTPDQINFKANIFALKELGCDNIVATSCCGSLQNEICPGEYVIFDQFINFSLKQEISFNNKNFQPTQNTALMYKPFSDDLRDGLIEACVINQLTTHTKGTIFSADNNLRQPTRAESNLYRQWGADVINKSTIAEVILANELGLNYAGISLCTHYEPWRTDAPPSGINERLEIMNLNSGKFSNAVISCFSILSAD